MEEQVQDNVATLVAGQKVEMVVAPVLDKVILALGIGIQQGGRLAHVAAEQDRTQFGSTKLSGKPVLAQLDLEQGFEPHFCLVLPLH